MDQKQLARMVTFISKSKYRSILNAIEKGNFRTEDIQHYVHDYGNSPRYCCVNLADVGLITRERDGKYTYHYPKYKKISMYYPPKRKIGSSFRTLEMILDDGNRKVSHILDLEQSRLFARLRIFDAVRQPKPLKELSRTVNIDKAVCGNYAKDLIELGLVKKEIKKVCKENKSVYSTTISSFVIYYTIGKRALVDIKPRSAGKCYGSIWYLTHGKPGSRFRKSGYQ